jgi:hypothetical protein
VQPYWQSHLELQEQLQVHCIIFLGRRTTSTLGCSFFGNPLSRGETPCLEGDSMLVRSPQSPTLAGALLEGASVLLGGCMSRMAHSVSQQCLPCEGYPFASHYGAALPYLL